MCVLLLSVGKGQTTSLKRAKRVWLMQTWGGSSERRGSSNTGRRNRIPLSMQIVLHVFQGNQPPPPPHTHTHTSFWTCYIFVFNANVFVFSFRSLELPVSRRRKWTPVVSSPHRRTPVEAKGPEGGGSCVTWFTNGRFVMTTVLWLARRGAEGRRDVSKRQNDRKWFKDSTLARHLLYIFLK